MILQCNVICISKIYSFFYFNENFCCEVRIFGHSKTLE